MDGFIFKELKTFGPGPGLQDYKIRTPAVRARRHLSDQTLSNDQNSFPGLFKIKLRAYGLGSEVVTAGQRSAALDKILVPMRITRFGQRSNFCKPQIQRNIF